MKRRLHRIGILGSLFLLMLSSAFGEEAQGTKACVAAGCFDLAKRDERAAYLQALQAKDPAAEEDADYSDLSKARKEKVRQAETDLVARSLATADPGQEASLIATVLEVRRSLELDRRARAHPAKALDPLELTQVVDGIIKDVFSSPFVRGKDPASAIPREATFREDRPTESLDLRVGMRPSIPADVDPGHNDCVYAKKKDSYGTNPGFTVKCGSHRLKLKFGDIRTEPFASRIMWALGYQVDPADFAPVFRLRFDPRIVTEFGTQPGAILTVAAAGIPIGRFRVRHSGIHLADFLSYGETADGARIDADQVFASVGHPELEAEIAYVYLHDVQVQLDDPQVIKLGQWSYDDFDHADDEEMRAAIVAFAWLGNFDVRRDNNRFVLDTSGNAPKWEFMVSDLGSCLGYARSRFAVVTRSEVPKAFGKRLTRNGRIIGYATLERNDAFRAATRAEAARAVARLYRLSPEQIETALAAAGYTANERTLYLELLLRRRDELREAYPTP